MTKHEKKAVSVFQNVSSYLKSQEISETAMSLDILPAGDAWNGYGSLNVEKEASWS